MSRRSAKGAAAERPRPRRDRFESPLLAYACAAEVDEAEGSGEATPAGGAFVQPLGSHALLLYKGSYNWNDNDFGLFVWGGGAGLGRASYQKKLAEQDKDAILKAGSDEVSYPFQSGIIIRCFNRYEEKLQILRTHNPWA